MYELFLQQQSFKVLVFGDSQGDTGPTFLIRVLLHTFMSSETEEALSNAANAILSCSGGVWWEIGLLRNPSEQLVDVFTVIVAIIFPHHPRGAGAQIIRMLNKDVIGTMAAMRNLKVGLVAPATRDIVLDYVQEHDDCVHQCAQASALGGLLAAWVVALSELL